MADSKRKQQKSAGLTIGFAVLGSLLLLFIILPLLGMLVGTSPAALLQALKDADVLASLGLTFYAAAWATGLAVITGVPLAYLLARNDFAGKNWVEGIINLPIVVPHTAAGIALLMLFGRYGFLGKAFGLVGLRFTDQVPGIVVGMLFVSLPFLVNAARDAFAAIDPELEAAAEADGASHWQVFLHITLPLAWRGIVGGMLMMWGRGISEFGAVVILAYNPKIVPVLVYERFAGFGLSAAQPVAVILILASLVVFGLLQAVLIPRKEKTNRE